MTSIPIFVVFEVQDNPSTLPSSYVQGNSPDEINQIIEKALNYYKSQHCSVQVLMGNRIEDLTQTPVVPVSELFKSVARL